MSRPMRMLRGEIMTVKKDEISGFNWKAQHFGSGIEIQLYFSVEDGGFFSGVSIAEGIMRALPLIRKKLEDSIQQQKQLAEESAAKKLKQALDIIKCHHPGIAYCGV